MNLEALKVAQAHVLQNKDEFRYLNYYTLKAK